MKRKDYEKPAMQVLELKQQPQILSASGGQGGFGGGPGYEPMP